MNEFVSALGSMFGAIPGALTNPSDPLAGAVSGGVNTLAALAGTPGVGEGLGLAGTAGTSAAGSGALGTAAANAATGAAGGLGEALGAAGGVLGSTAGTLGDALAGSVGEALGSGVGGQGFATGVDSLAGALGSGVTGGADLGVGSIGEIINPASLSASTLPAGPGVAEYLPSAATQLLPAAESAAAAPTTAIGKAFADPSLSNIFEATLANKDLIGAGVGLAPVLAGGSAMPGEDELKAMAQQMGANSTVLTGYLSSGTLPPGLQAGLNSAREAAKASMRSMFASRGMSGSSSEVAALANIDQTTAAQGAEIAMKLLDKGIQQGQLSSALYQTILRNAMAEDAAMGQAVGRFAAALAA